MKIPSFLYRIVAALVGQTYYVTTRETMAYAGSLKRHDIPKDFVFPGWGDSIWRYCDEDTPATNPVMKKGWKVDINDTKENQVPEPPPDPDPDPDPTKVVEVRITLEDGSIQEFVPK